MSTIVQRINEFNFGRDPELLELKHKRMSESASRFFRGSCHLFYEDLHQNEFLKNSPKGWICGDLHLENFGTFEGSDGINYFDINDFDEAMLSPILWDVCRLLVSIEVFANDLKLNKKFISKSQKQFLENYIQEIKNGKSLICHQQSSKGVIYDLFKKIKDRKTNYLLKTKTENEKKIIIENEKTYKLNKNIKNQLLEIFQTELNNHPNLNNFKCIDLVGRIAGTGSLGLPRYLLLIYNKKNNLSKLLDIKSANLSSLKKYNSSKQPYYNLESERIVAAQNLLQFQSPKLLESWNIGFANYVIKDYQPTEDKIDLLKLSKNKENFKDFVVETAKILAWAQIRCAGRNGSYSYDELNIFFLSTEIQQPLLEISSLYSKKVFNDFKNFKNQVDGVKKK